MERELFDLDILVGNWESINLNPTVMIHRNGECHQLSIIHMNEITKQASPATYEIQEDGQGCFIVPQWQASFDYLLPKVGYANHCHIGRLYEKLTINESWIYSTTNLRK